MTAAWKRRLFIASFIWPTLILFLVFTVYPVLRGMYYSAFDWSGTAGTMDYIGARNFRDLVDDPIVGQAIANDYFLVFWKIVGIMALAIFFAVSLSRFKVRGSKFYRFAFFLPNVISVVVIGVLWRFIYNPKLGLLNGLLSSAQGKTVETPWLGDSTYAMWALLPPAVWAGVGFFMILLIAGIKGIPESLYESAAMDGAKQWTQFSRITLPLVWEQIKVSVVLIMLTSLNGSFAIVSIMTEGGPDNATQVLGYYLYQMGFRQYHMGYASAIGIVILALSLVTTVALQRIMKRESVELS
ncbi:carbohydrate ABC transporter permease [Cohnella sp. GCM10027633]|uniref:carbohydrate ABC transporter permease n=1 Tax=unclassified Cohnella TaxID=2636738 RepID=UPI0036369257